MANTLYTVPNLTWTTADYTVFFLLSAVLSFFHGLKGSGQSNAELWAMSIASVYLSMQFSECVNSVSI